MSEIAVEVLRGGWPIAAFVLALFAISLVLFGFMPGALNRAFALFYPIEDPRRNEMVAELYAVPRLDQPWWVFQQSERALFEGLGARRRQKQTQVKASRKTIQSIARSSWDMPGGRYPPYVATFSFVTKSVKCDDRSCLRIVREMSTRIEADTISLPCEAAADRAIRLKTGYRVKRGMRKTTVYLEVFPPHRS
jgi:hypothetical protein